MVTLDATLSLAAVTLAKLRSLSRIRPKWDQALDLPETFLRLDELTLSPHHGERSDRV